MFAPSSAIPEGHCSGVFGRISHRRRRPGAGDPPVVTPMPMLAALEALAALRGSEHDPAALGAALPMAQEGLAAKLAPLALARIGLEARWCPLGHRLPHATELPILTPMESGGAVLLTGLAADHVIVRDAAPVQSARWAGSLPVSPIRASFCAPFPMRWPSLRTTSPTCWPSCACCTRMPPLTARTSAPRSPRSACLRSGPPRSMATRSTASSTA